LFPYAYLNGRLVALADARVSILDHGLLYGDSCFEAIRVHGGHPAFWRAHLARLAESARLLELPDPGTAQWTAALAALIEANSLTEAMVRLTLTRGAAPPGLAPEEPPAATCIACAAEPPVPPAASRCVTARWKPIPADCLPSAAKSGNYLPNLLARRVARAAGADEALFTDATGRYLEGTVSNLFFVDPEGRLCTPPLTAGVLPGITRGLLLAAATHLGIEPRWLCPTRTELLTSREALLSGTGYAVCPIASLDGEPLSTGPLTLKLAAAYHTAITRDHAQDPLP